MSTKRNFVLKNVKISNIEKNYVSQELFSKMGNSLEEKEVDKLTSKIEKLNFSTLKVLPHEQIRESKHHPYTNLYYCMKDISNKKRLPDKIDLPCFNCNEKFDNKPFGIPIKYYPSIIKSIYTSEINGQKQMTYRSLTTRERENCKSKDLIVREYFDTDGIFCGIPCLLRYLQDHRVEPLYKNSISLVRLMIKLRYPTTYSSKNYYCAPSNRLLKNRGGILSISEYRKLAVEYPCVIFNFSHQYIRNNGISEEPFENNSEIDEEPINIERPVSIIFEQTEQS